MKSGEQTYDIFKKQNFQINFFFLWTIGNFYAYSILSEWSIAEKLVCFYCIEHSDVFSLSRGRNISWFNNHRMFFLWTIRSNRIQ